ncbi:MAG: pyruvate dehydrogenase complex dihydrolipoamide acetyltransferase [Pontixanthobacter sp.]
MPTAIKMPALSPTMEEGTLAKWLVKEGDSVSSGDIMAEIETDKATMEFEAVDEGTIASIMVDEGTEGVQVGTVIAMLAEEGESVEDAKAAAPEPTSQNDDSKAQGGSEAAAKTTSEASSTDLHENTKDEAASDVPQPSQHSAPPKQIRNSSKRIIASPLARRIAANGDIDLANIRGSGPNGRIVKADVENAEPASAKPADLTKEDDARNTSSAQSAELPDFDIPHEDEKLGNVRKVIARRLTEAKQTIPHIYLTVDIQLDALLDLRKQLNEALDAQDIKLSVNDLLIKALAKALQQVPQCNVSYGGNILRKYSRADVSVAVAAPSGLITPIVKDAGGKAVSQISTEMKSLASKARDGKLQPQEYQGGTASLSNLGMFGTKQFDAVINPPQAMILAVGAGEKRPYVLDGELSVATIMTATGSFDHRAIDGVDGAKLMEAFKMSVENPLALVA